MNLSGQLCNINNLSRWLSIIVGRPPDSAHLGRAKKRSTLGPNCHAEQLNDKHNMIVK